MAVLVDVITVPGTIASGTWTSAAATLNGGRWKGSFTPTAASTASTYNDYHALIASADNGGLWLGGTGGRQFALYKSSDGAPVFEKAITWSAGQTINYEITLAVGTNASTVAISGATTGNGTFNFTHAGPYFTSGTALGTGRWPNDTFYDFAGSISDVEDGSRAPLTANSGSFASTGTAVALRVARRLAAASAAIAIVGSSVGLVGPSTYTLDAGAGAVALTGSSVNFPRTRVLKVDPGSTAIAGTSATLAKSGGIELGNHDFTAQTYGSATSPNRVTMDVTAGSCLLLGRGGKLSDFSTIPTTSVGTFKLIDQNREFADWSGYGTAQYILRQNTGGTGVNFDCAVTAFDEHTSSVIEVRGVNTLAASVWSQHANSGAASTQSTSSITITEPTAFVLDWWGAGPVGGGNHVVSAMLSGAAMQDLGGWTTDDLDGYVQHKRFFLIVNPPGTYDATVTHSPVQGAQLRLTALQKDRSLVADSGSVSAGGSTVGLRYSRAPLAASGGSVSVTGTAAGLVRSTSFPAAPGATSISGTALGLRVSRLPLTASGGSVGIAGSDAALSASRALVAGSGAVGVSGSSAGLARSLRVGASGGLLGITGTAANLRAARVVSAGQGAIAVTGTASLFRRALRLVASGGGVDWIGADASLDYSAAPVTDFVLEPGALTCSGAALGTRVSRRISLGSGSTSVTGLSITLRKSTERPHLQFVPGSPSVSIGAVATSSTVVPVATSSRISAQAVDEE